MCGLSGYLGSGEWVSSTAFTEVLTRMNTALMHRGPDDGGLWHDASAGIGLAHRRLSVVDISAAGHQPMHSPCSRYTMAFNGEIYNHLDLRAELQRDGLAPVWRGHSDTETLLAGFSAWGIQPTILRANGMFALAIWDKEAKTLTLGRDRLGEKPLYYGWQGSGSQACFLFGSELKALKAHPGFSANIDRGALALFLRHGYIPAPYSIYQHIQKLSPGSLLSVSLAERSVNIVNYWSAVDVAHKGRNQPYQGDALSASDELERLLQSALKQQMVADVPLGAFLSGGVDSSVIVALMQAQSPRPIKTFTIGFHEAAYNEAIYAKAVATHLGTEHTELYVTPQQALEVIPRLPTLYCEPFADSSQIPTFLVSQLARQTVTVALSGDAGDELFCGYNRYTDIARIDAHLFRLPFIARSALANTLLALSIDRWNTLLTRWQKFLPGVLKKGNIGQKLHKGAALLALRSIEQYYYQIISLAPDPSVYLIQGTEPATFLNGNMPNLKGFDCMSKAMLLDTISYLPDDILVKVDRAAMGVSLETRVPFLDPRIVEFAWRLPQSMKYRDGVGKWILREVLYRHVPKNLIERPKMGFGVPIASWLRGPLRDWAEALLNEERLKREGYFQAETIRQHWHEHLSGRRDRQISLWPVLMFQAWLAEQ